ncbi:MAG: group 1 truncated hemoglobin [Verrucomicrobiota bacterium]
MNYALLNKIKTTRRTSSLIVSMLSFALTCSIGCGTAKTAKKKDDFFTSGSREADQRASQRMAKDEQLAGSGEGAGEKNAKKAVAARKSSSEGGTNQAAQVEGKLALFDRLGGVQGIAAIVDDFTPRVLQDPRVNWSRKGVKSSRFSLFKKDSEANAWSATPANIAILKKHLVQFVVLATGGPAHYDGKEMKSVHAGMRISNPEFDAVLGDLKASLDRLQIPNKEQKELLSIVESTRPQIVTQR